MAHGASCISFSRFANASRVFWISQSIPVSFSIIKKKGIVNEGVKGPEVHEGLECFLYVIIPETARTSPFPTLLPPPGSIILLVSGSRCQGSMLKEAAMGVQAEDKSGSEPRPLGDGCCQKGCRSGDGKAAPDPCRASTKQKKKEKQKGLLLSFVSLN